MRERRSAKTKQCPEKNKYNTEAQHIKHSVHDHAPPDPLGPLGIAHIGS